MAIAYRAGSTGTASAATTVSATKPANTAQFDLLIAACHADTAAATIEPADGLTWNELLADSSTGSTFRIQWRLAGASEPSSYSFRRTDVAADNFSLGIAAYSGVDQANPIDTPDSFVRPSSATCNITAFSTTVNNTFVIGCDGIGSNTTLLTPPSGFTQGFLADGFNPGSTLYHKALASAGTSGTITFVLTASTTQKGYGFALRPDLGYSYSGQSNPGSGANTDNAGSAISWTNPGNVTAADDVRTTAVTTGVTVSDFLDATAYGFALPAGATVNGVEVNVEHFRNGGTTGEVVDSVLSLIVSGAIVGANKASATAWGTAEFAGGAKSIIYGAPDDGWSASLTAAQVNDSTFGVRLAVTGSGVTTNRVANVDSIRVTVYYTDNSVTGTASATLSVVGSFAAAETFAGTLGATLALVGAASGTVTDGAAQATPSAIAAGSSGAPQKMPEWLFAPSADPFTLAIVRDNQPQRPRELEEARKRRDEHDLAMIAALLDEDTEDLR